MNSITTPIFDGFHRPVEISINPHITQFAGLAPLLHHARKLGFHQMISEKLVPTFPNLCKGKQRDSKYGMETLFWQRLAAHCVGFEDLNDADKLKHDMGFKLALGVTELASTSTLCHAENKITQETIDKGNEILQDFYLKWGPHRRVLFIDVDNTPVETFGYQENRKFNSHYRCNCYLPLLAFIDGFPVGVFNGTEDGRATMMKVFKPLVEKIKARRKNTTIVLRADSGFNGTNLINLCEDLGIYYVVGLPKNPKLVEKAKKIDPTFMNVVQNSYEGRTLRCLGEVDDYMAATWRGPRRVIVRDYFNELHKSRDIRFITTNIPKENDGKCGYLWKIKPEKIYEDLYCQRGLEEQFNQEFKVQAFGKRTSAHRFLTNSYRMLLAAFCQLLFRVLRTNFFRKDSSFRGCTLVKFRKTFVTVPAIIKNFKSKVRISLLPGEIGPSILQRYWHFKL